jgi:hypothetical protein
LIESLRQIKVSDLVVPGRKIDVPVELIATRKCNCQEHQDEAKTVLTV